MSAESVDNVGLSQPSPDITAEHAIPYQPTAQVSIPVMLESMPTEINDHIFSFLEEEDFLLLRLVCRWFNSTTFKAFGDAWFATIKFDFSERDLQRLENISRHETIRKFVRHLRINAYRNGNEVLGSGYEWTRESDCRLDMSAAPIDFLRVCLVNRLVNCKSFDVPDSSDGSPWIIGTPSKLTPTDVVDILFCILARHSLPVRSFRVDFFLSRSNLFPIHIHPGIHKAPQFQQSWASTLQDLDLRWQLQLDESCQMAIDLITMAKNLRKLTLDWRRSEESQIFFQRLEEVKSLPNIKDLTIRSMDKITHTTLLHFLSRFQNSLVALDFSSTQLITGSWSNIFAELRDGFPHLKYITIHQCRQEHERGRVFFCPLRQNPKVQGYGEFELANMIRFRKKVGRAVGVRYISKGKKDMELALDILEKSVYYLYHGGPPSPGYPGKGLPFTTGFEPMEH